jgi:hypothetical protein
MAPGAYTRIGRGHEWDPIPILPIYYLEWSRLLVRDDIKRTVEVTLNTPLRTHCCRLNLRVGGMFELRLDNLAKKLPLM